VPIVQGAGGVISDWHGADAVKGESTVAATPGLHAEVIRILNS
jgi:fructose-1,6-bisphosphatase/inositol monophosphatase family enzyme